MHRLLLATHNLHKTREFVQILGKEFEIIDLSSTKDFPVLEETGSTFAENAMLKAIAASKKLPGLIMADDSGLEVDALGGEPGIFSARYAGKNAGDKRNIEKLLGALKRAVAKDDQSSARFRCAIALGRDGKLLATFEGTVEGVIVESPSGKEGFGYDPIFQPNGFDKTFSEIPVETKNQISHRAQAAQKLARYFKRMRP